jgi:hypothetical protein
MKRAPIILIGMIVSLLLLFNTSQAKKWYLHPDSSTIIQSRVDSAGAGDTLELTPGIYKLALYRPDTIKLYLMKLGSERLHIILF